MLLCCCGFEELVQDVDVKTRVAYRYCTLVSTAPARTQQGWNIFGPRFASVRPNSTKSAPKENDLTPKLFHV